MAKMHLCCGVLFPFFCVKYSRLFISSLGVWWEKVWVVVRYLMVNQTKALCHTETMQMLLRGQHQPARFMALVRLWAQTTARSDQLRGNRFVSRREGDLDPEELGPPPREIRARHRQGLWMRNGQIPFNLKFPNKNWLLIDNTGKVITGQIF